MLLGKKMKPKVRTWSFTVDWRMKQPPESDTPGSPARRDLSHLPSIAEALRKSHSLHVACHKHRRGHAESQAVPAQSHLSFAVVAAGTEPPVLGVVAGAAEEQRLLLEVALVDVLGHCWVKMVHLVLGAVAGDAEPGNKDKGGSLAAWGVSEGFLVLFCPSWGGSFTKCWARSLLAAPGTISAMFDSPWLDMKAQRTMQDGVTLATQTQSPEITPTLAWAMDGSGNHAPKCTHIFFILTNRSVPSPWSPLTAANGH